MPGECTCVGHTISGPFETGDHIDRLRGLPGGRHVQSHRRAALGDIATTGAQPIQRQVAYTILLGKHDQRFDGAISGHGRSKDGVEQLDRLGHRCGCDRLVKRGVALLRDAQNVGHGKALVFAIRGIPRAVKAVGDLVDRQVALAVTIFIAAQGKVMIQHKRERPERGVILLVGVNGRIFIDQIHRRAMFFAHGQAGEGPGVIVGVEHLRHVVDVAVGLAALRHRLRVLWITDKIDQRLYAPDQPHIVGAGPTAGRQIAHLATKGDALAVRLIFDHGQRHIDHLGGAVGGKVVDRDVEGGQVTLWRQIGAGRGHTDLQHGEELEIAVGLSGIRHTPAAGGDIGITFVINILHLPGTVLGPVEYVKGVPEMFGILRAQLKLDKGGCIGGKIVKAQLQGCILTEGGRIGDVG